MSARDARIRIGVYRVEPATGRRHELRPACTYPGDGRALHALTVLWPPCRCPRCTRDGDALVR